MSEIVATLTPPQILKYSDYREFMRDFYRFKKSQNRGFSFRKFSSMASIKSSNYLMLVMNQKRNLLPGKAKLVARAMRLSKNETDFFISLVKIDRTESPEERSRFEIEKNRALRKMIGKDMPADKVEYLSRWYLPIVRELAYLPGFKPSTAWVSSKLSNLITEDEAESAIEMMFRLGLWKLRAGRVEVSDGFLDTGDEGNTFGEINVVSIHQQNLIAWSKMIARLPKETRELGLINIPISDAKIPEFKKRIQKFQDEIIGWLESEQAPTRIVQLGTYLIPLT